MKSKYRKYNEGGPVKPKKRKSPVSEYFESAPKGTKIVELKYNADYEWLFLHLMMVM